MNLNAPPPALQVIWDANYVRMTGCKTLHIVDVAISGTRPDPLTTEAHLPFEVTILTDGEHVILENEEFEVKSDPFTPDAFRSIEFIKVQS